MPNQSDLEALRIARSAAGAPQAMEPDEPVGLERERRTSFADDVGNAVMAIPRGVAAGVMDAANLFGADWNENPFGKSNSIAAGLIEGIANFAVGFVPAAGIVARAGRVAKGLKLVKSGAESLSFLKASKGLTLAGNVAAGALADVTVFNAHDGRLADVMKLHPGLQAATEDYIGWLQTHDDDSEAWGRVKNVLEGAGVGAMASAFHSAISRYAKGKRKLTQEGQVAMDELNDVTGDLAGEIDAGRAGGDDTATFFHPDGADTITALREGDIGVHPTNPTNQFTFNLDGTHSSRGDGSVSLASVIVGTEDLTRENIARFVNRFPSLHGESDVKVSIENFGKTILGDRKGPDQWAISLDVVGQKDQKGLLGLAADDVEARNAYDDLKAPKGPGSPSAAPGGNAGPNGKGGLPDASTPALRSLGLNAAKLDEVLSFVKTGKTLRKNLGLKEGLNARNLTALERAKLSIQRGDLNLSRNSLNQDAHMMMRATEELFRVAIHADAHLEVQHLDQMYQSGVDHLAMIAGKSADKEQFTKNMLMDMREASRTQEDLAARVIAHEQYVLKFSDEIAKEGRAIREGGGSPARKAEFIIKYQQYSEALSIIKGTRNKTGRALRALGHGGKFGRLMKDDDLIFGTIDAAGGDKAVDDLIDKIVTASEHDGTELGKAAAAARAGQVAELTVSRQTLNIVTEYWINALLSAPTTPVINAISGMALSIYRPLESFGGANLARMLARDPALKAAHARNMRAALGELTGLFSGVSDALMMAKKTLLTAESVITPDIRTLDSVAAKDRTAIHTEMEGPIGAAINWIGSIVRLPSHVMAGGDEFFRQLTYRSYAKAQFALEAADLGKVGGEVGAHIERRMNELSKNGSAYSMRSLQEEGAAIARANGETDLKEITRFARKYAKKNFKDDLGLISETGLKYAREVTLSTPLERGTIAHSVQTFAQNHPIARFIFPFIRTPMNVIYSVGQRVPASGVQYLTAKLTETKFPKMAAGLNSSKDRFIRDLLSGDSRRIADAHGRWMMGVAAIGMGMFAAESGLITGRGPSDPAQRKALTDAGWLPYAVRTEKGYVSYARLDPFATAIGMFADLHEIQKFSHNEDRSATESLMVGVGVALANNFTNKSYLVGLANFVEMLQSPDKSAEGWARKMAASFVPNVAKSLTTAAGDDDIRDVKTMADAFRAKIPFLADNVRPFRNVLGEPVTKITAAGSDAISGWLDAAVPFSYRQVAHDGIRQELADIVLNGGGAIGPPGPNRYGLDLREIKRAGSNQDAYDRWAELVGEVKVRGRTIRTEMESMMKSARYKSLPRQIDSDFGSPRAREVMSTIQEYRNEAWRQLTKEYPELAARERAFLDQKRDLTSGGNSLRTYAANLK